MVHSAQINARKGGKDEIFNFYYYTLRSFWAGAFGCYAGACPEVSAFHHNHQLLIPLVITRR